MVGPSARGSENGTPTSTKSAPASSITRSAASDCSGVGKPAVRYGMSAARFPVPAFRMARHRATIAWSDKVVADVDAVFDGIGDLDDRAGEGTLGIALGEISQKAGMLQCTVGRGHDPRARPDFGYPVRSVFMWCS